MRLNKSMKGILSLALVAVVSAFMFAVSPAQETSGSIQGTVSDATGARVPGVSIKIDGSNETRTATADADGFTEKFDPKNSSFYVPQSSKTFVPIKNQAFFLGYADNTHLKVACTSRARVFCCAA